MGDEMSYQTQQIRCSKFYSEIVSKTKLASNHNVLMQKLYDALKIRIEDAAEEGLNNCYVEPNWKYNRGLLIECLSEFEMGGFIVEEFGIGFKIRWEGNNGYYDEGKETTMERIKSGKGLEPLI